MAVRLRGGLLAELPANRPCREHGAVNVYVVVLPILSGGLDQLLAHARGAAASTVGAGEGNTGEQWDHYGPGNPGGCNMDVCGDHGAVDPSPAEVEADLTLALVERDERQSGGVGIARPRHLRRPGERGRERAAFPKGGSGYGEQGDHPEGGSEKEDATSHGYRLCSSDDNRGGSLSASTPTRGSLCEPLTGPPHWHLTSAPS